MRCHCLWLLALLVAACSDPDGNEAPAQDLAEDIAEDVAPDGPDDEETSPGEGCEGLPWRFVAGTTGPDTAWSVAAMPGGDILLAGQEGPALATDIVLRRMSSNGVVRWEGRWDSGEGDEAFVVIPDPDGLAWVGGLRRSDNVLDPDTASVLVRFDLDTGALVGTAWTWDSGGWDELDGIAVEDGEVYLSGWAQGSSGTGELRVYSLDADTLSVRWQASLDNAGLDAGNGHLVLWEEVVIVGGSWKSGGLLANAQGVVAALNRTDGQVEWTSEVGDGTDYREILGLASDGSRVFAAGWRKITLLDWQLMVWAFEDDGTFLWESEWGGVGNERSRALAVDPLDGTLLVAGTTNGTGQNDDIVLLRLDPDDGTLLHQEVWGGSRGEGAQDITVDGARLYVSGPTNSWGAGNSDILAIGVCHRPWILPE